MKEILPPISNRIFVEYNFFFIIDKNNQYFVLHFWKKGTKWAIWGFFDKSNHEA